MVGGPDDLRRELALLKQRVEALEKILGATEVPAPQTAPLPEPAQPHRPSSLESDASPIRAQTIEARIGSQVLNRVGILAVLAGMAWFLKLAIDRAWIGPGVRIEVGIAVACGLFLWSERFRRRGFAGFSYTLKALGTGIAYLSLWAAYSAYHLLPGPVAFLAMVSITVANALLSIRQSSELLAGFALIGGLATPELLSAAPGHELFLFAYLLLLDFGALFLSAYRPWPRLAVGAFTGTTIYIGLGWSEYSETANLGLSACGMALFFLLFTAAPFLVLLRNRFQRQTRYDRLLLGLPVAVGACALVETAGLLHGREWMQARTWLAILAGTIYLLLAARVSSRVEEFRPFLTRLKGIHLSLGISLIVLAAAIPFDGYGIVLCWLAELGALAISSVRLRANSISGVLRSWTLVLCGICVLSLVSLDVFDRQSPKAVAFLNAHFATFLAGAGVFAFVAWISEAKASEGRAPGFPEWRFISLFSGVAFSVVALLSVALQIDTYWHHQLAGHATVAPIRRPAYVDFSYSAWSMLYGAGLMAVGFWRRSAFLRWQALLILALSVGKVFLFDIVHLSQGYRVISFLGLGVLLLAISFAYQRDWLELRTR